MKVLAVETATAWQSVAILDGERILARTAQDAKGSHARTLLPAIDRLFKETGLTLNDLQGLAVSIGPGSFTGLRVGLATMLGFRTVTKLPLVVVPTLEAMAWNLRGTSLPICPILKSRIGEVYWAQYQWTDRRTLVQLLDERVGSPHALAQTIEKPLLVCGDGWLTYGDDIRAASGLDARMLTEADAEAMHPSAVSVALAALPRLAKGEVAGIGVAPRYVQRTAAELTQERRDGRSAAELRQQRVARKLDGKSRQKRHARAPAPKR